MSDTTFDQYGIGYRNFFSKVQNRQIVRVEDKDGTWLGDFPDMYTAELLGYHYAKEKGLSALSDADYLDLLQAAENDGRGISCVRDIVGDLRRGDFNGAKAIRRHDGDKTRNYPAVEAALTAIFGCRTHGVHDCDNWLCKELSCNDE